MSRTEEYDKLMAGIISGFVCPFIVGLILFTITSNGKTMAAYLEKIVAANIITHAITLCVVPNLFIFLLFNRLDMLHASRGVLGITIAWAVTVFIVKFL